MSGFLTCWNRDGAPADEPALDRLAAALEHRGPDGTGVQVLGQVGMAHAMLHDTPEAIGETQPATLDGEVWLVGDMRLDDRSALLSALGQDAPAPTAPDSHLILAAYGKWGDACPEHLLGDFAFVVWDSRKQALFAARDPFGVKSLFRMEIGATLYVGNSLRSLTHVDGFDWTLDEETVADFLLFNSHWRLDNTQTPFRSVRGIPAGHRVLFTAAGDRMWPHWEWPIEPGALRFRSGAELAEAFRHQFAQAVEDRLRAPGRMCLSLSGGLDSGSYAAMAAHLLGGSAPALLEVHTIFWGRIHDDHDEKRFADLTADHLRLPHRYIDANQCRLIEPGLFDLEMNRLAILSFTWALESQMAGRSRVVLNGRTADNLLARPSLSRSAALARRLGPRSPVRALWHALRRRRGMPAEVTAPYAMPDYLQPGFAARTQAGERWRTCWTRKPTPTSVRNPEAQRSMLYPDWSEWTADTLGTVTRDPYLDLRVVNFVLGVPPVPWAVNKKLLREAMAPYLPREVVTRPKLILGDAITSLAVAGGAEANEWEPDEALGEYVDAARVGPLTVDGKPAEEILAALKARALSNWLGELRRYRAAVLQD